MAGADSKLRGSKCYIGNEFEVFSVENKERSKKHQCAREFLWLVRVRVVSLASQVEWKLMLVCPTMPVINL
jgi:hypothetical protein